MRITRQLCLRRRLNIGKYIGKSKDILIKDVGAFRQIEYSKMESIKITVENNLRFRHNLKVKNKSDVSRFFQISMSTLFDLIMDSTTNQSYSSMI